MNRHDGVFNFRYWTSKTDHYTKSYPDFSLGGIQIVKHSLVDPAARFSTSACTTRGVLDPYSHPVVRVFVSPLDIPLLGLEHRGWGNVQSTKATDWDVPALNKARDVDRMLRNTLEKKATCTENLQPRRWVLKFRPCSTSALRKCPCGAIKIM